MMDLKVIAWVVIATVAAVWSYRMRVQTERGWTSSTMRPSFWSVWTLRAAPVQNNLTDM